MRPAIDESRYHAQIEDWLNQGRSLDAITGTMLQKAVGGRYDRTCTILDNFKAGYEQKEIPQIKELSEAEMQEALMIVNKLIRFISRSDLAGMEKMKVAHQEELAARDAANADQANRIEELIETETSLKEQVADVTTQLAELTRKLDDLQDINHTLRQDLVQKHELCEQQEIRLAEKDQQVARLEADFKQSVESRDSAQQTFTEITTELNDKLVKAEKSAEDAKGQLAMQAKTNASVKKQLDDLTPKYDQLKQDYKQLGENAHANELELGKAITKTKGLEDQVRNLTGLLKAKEKTKTAKVGNKTTKAK